MKNKTKLEDHMLIHAKFQSASISMINDAESKGAHAIAVDLPLTLEE